MDALPMPPAALRDGHAVELARVWIAEQGLHCSLKFGLYADDGLARETIAWGIILADLAGHVADALRAEGMGAKADLLEAIMAGFNAEVSPRRPDEAARPAQGSVDRKAARALNPHRFPQIRSLDVARHGHRFGRRRAAR